MGGVPRALHRDGEPDAGGEPLVAADTNVVTVTDAHRRFHEYGAKFRLHLEHAQPLFFGAGIGLEYVDIAGVQVMPSAHSSMSVDNEISGVMVDVETGRLPL